MPKVKDPSGKWNESLALIPTRAPKTMWDYIKWVAKNPALGVDTLQEFTSLAAIEFLTTKPWLRGLKIRQAEAIGDAPRRTAGPNGICQTNISFCPVIMPDGRRVTGGELRKMFEATAEEIQNAGIQAIRANGGKAKVSTATLAYTFLFWLAVMKYPPGAPMAPLRRFTLREAEESGLGMAK